MSRRNPSLPQGVRRTCRLFWCYQCHRAIRIISSPTADVFCPRCYGQFLHEIDLPQPRLLVDYTGLHHPPGTLPHFPLPPPILGPSPWRGGNELSRIRWLDAEDGLRDRRHWVARAPEPRRAPLIIPTSPPERTTPPAVQPGDYFTGHGLNELIDQLTQNDRPGQPAAPASAIDAMPTVLIAEAHLADGSQCPVCKEEFGLGEEAREMPCKHVYHSDCIVPWLRIHNSCPVCRFQLPVSSANAAQRNDGEDSLGGGNWEDLPGSSRDWERRLNRWNPFSLLWPSRALPPPVWDHPYRSRQEAHDVSDTGNAFYSWWRSLFLL